MVLATPSKSRQLVKLLRYLVEVGGGRGEAVEDVLRQLREEGWLPHPCLPAGWLRRAREGKGVHYLSFSPTFGKYSTLVAAVGCMRRQGLGRAAMARLLVIDSGVAYRLAEEGEEGWAAGRGLPEGWRVRGQEVRSPEGLVYRDRVGAVRHLVVEQGREVFPREEVALLRAGLVEEEWEEHTMLPEEWRVRRTSTSLSFLTREARVMATFAEALAFISYTRNRFTVSEQSNFREAEGSFREKVRVVPSLREKTMVEEEVMPRGWRMERLAEEVVRITAPDGSSYYSRLRAMVAMLEAGVGEAEVARVWGELGREGWLFQLPHLPLGWGARRQEGEEGFIFLTRELEVLVSAGQALAYIETEDSYTGEEYKRLDAWVDAMAAATWQQEEELPEGWRAWDLAEEDEESMFMEVSTGTVLAGRVALLRQLVVRGEEGEVVRRLWETVDREGWMVDRDLPPGWRSKYDLDSSTYLHLSPTMEVVAAPTDLLARGQVEGEERLVVDQVKAWAKLRGVGAGL